MWSTVQSNLDLELCADLASFLFLIEAKLFLIVSEVLGHDLPLNNSLSFRFPGPGAWSRGSAVHFLSDGVAL